MTSTLIALAFTAITISFFHTASGPDHYLPFIVLSRSRKWSKMKTIFLTITCGLGHVLSSVILGLAGLFLGWQLNKVSWLQDVRGNVSSWALLAFGVIYLIYGLRQAFLNKPHKHFDVMGEEVYVYTHKHGEMVMPGNKVKVTPLVLFAIFVMGPSEPLIPLLFYSGTKRSVPEVVVLLSVFTISTVLTMLGMVLLGVYGYSFFKTDKLERYVHAIGGAVVTICGIGMVFLGW
ncbi:sulfite exporter TauE/SafE family protein [Pedobacter sp. PAMC26386]|nr:sulfite exporter TauE/SafE family protein [Pedobacter sp. PAMC26386]